MKNNYNSVKIDGKLYQCPECKFWYKDKIWAEKCELWCNERKTCNVEIITHGYPPESKELN